MFICWLSPNKKIKNKKNLHSTWVYQTRVLCKFFFFLKVLEPGILEYYVAWYSSLPSSSTTIFFNRTNSNSAMPRWQNWWGTRVFETRVLEKVVLCHLFPKQCFFAKNFQKMWYLAILALFYMYKYPLISSVLYLLVPLAT